MAEDVDLVVLVCDTRPTVGTVCLPVVAGTETINNNYCLVKSVICESISWRGLTPMPVLGNIASV